MMSIAYMDMYASFADARLVPLGGALTLYSTIAKYGGPHSYMG
jgi:hypothetical protein